MEQTSEIDPDGAALGSGDSQDPAADYSSTKSPQISSTPTTCRPRREDDDDQTSKGTRTGSRPTSHTLMYQASRKGDWQAAEILLGQDPNIASVKMAARGNTALHIAIAMMQTQFVRKLVEWMSPSDLELQNEHDETAFYYAAASGIVEMAAIMRVKNDRLVTIRNKDNMTPLYIATRCRKKDMVLYLYKFTRVEDLVTKEWFDIIHAAVSNKMYDLASKMLRENESLAAMTYTEGKTMLHLLARQDMSYVRVPEVVFERLVTMFAALRCFSGLKRIFEQVLMRERARLLAENLWAKIQRSEQIGAVELINEPPILQEAAEVGNAGFIDMLVSSDLDLLFGIDDRTHTIFHIAVIYQQETVFRLIHEIGFLKDSITRQIDVEGNNILHLAGKLSPLSRREIVSGAALQLQRELLWFKEVEKIVPPECLEMKNDQGFRPRELFSKEHQRLLKDGEKWMKETANSCILLATLIATVVFAAAITAPGGNNNDTGIPILLNRRWFDIFVVSDGVAMLSSTSSIIIFLSILTSRFREDDFLMSLPMKLMAGFTALIISVVSTLFAFASTFFLIFCKEGELVLEICEAAFVCVLIIGLLGSLYFWLFLDMVRSISFRHTIGPS